MVAGMQNEWLFRSDQGGDIPVLKAAKLGGCTAHHAFIRAFETRSYGDPSQDYLIYRLNGEQLTFAVCDGVGMSFQGGFAARFLGERLHEWLCGHPSPFGLSLGQLERDLLEWTKDATRLTRELPLPPDTVPMLRSVLEEKRASGSEAMFACGSLMFPRQGRAGRLSLFWSGDIRVRLWREGQELVLQGDPTYQTNQRWSTLRGAIGGSPMELHLTWEEQDSLRLLVYTDGGSNLDAGLSLPDLAHMQHVLQEAAAEPSSDDITVLHVDWPGGTKGGRVIE